MPVQAGIQWLRKITSLPNKMPKEELANLLSEGLITLDLELGEAQQYRLLDYLELLERWNRVHNLTAVRDIRQMVGRHLLDSLTVLPYLQGGKVIDLGSGAGLPGIPIAVSKPAMSVTMIDSSQRKTRFVQQAIATLRLENATVLHSRVQEKNLDAAPCVVARAFSSPVDIIECCQHLCAENGVFVLMMGHIGELLDHLPAPFGVEAVHEVHAPQNEGVRHIAVCRRLINNRAPQDG